MSPTAPHAPLPWTRADVRYAARAAGWPRITLPNGQRLEGEAGWTAALATATPAQCDALRAALRERRA